MMDFFDSLSNARKDEVEDLVALESAEIAAEKACLAYNYARDLQDLRNAEAELKWYAESGDTNELIGYYEAAKTTETEQKTEGLLKKAWTAVKNLFEKIKNAIFKKKVEPPKDPKRKIKVPKPFALICKKLKSAWNAVKSAVISGKKKLSENGNWKKLLIVLGVVGLAGAGVAAAHNNSKNKVHKLTDDEVEICVGVVVNARDTAKEIVETVTVISDKTAKDPSKQIAENVDAYKQISGPVRKFGAEAERILLLEDKVQYAPGPTNHLIEDKTVYASGPVASMDEALSSMSPEKLSRIVKKCVVAKDGESTWETVKFAWEPKSLNKAKAVNMIKSSLKRGDITEDHIYATESVSDEYFALDMDGFVESNYGDASGHCDDDFDDDFFENL